MDQPRISVEEFTELCVANPCEQGTVEFDAWMRAVLRGANNQIKDAPTETHIPAYHEGWNVGQAWFKQNRKTDEIST